MILVDKDLERLVLEKRILVDGSRSPSAFSIDAGFSQFYECLPHALDKVDLTLADVRAVPWPRLLSPRSVYLATVDVPLDLPAQHHILVGARSTYARVGVWPELVTGDARANVQGYKGSPLIQLRTAGTFVTIEPHEQPLNLLVDVNDSYVHESELTALVQSGQFGITRGDASLRESDLEFGHVPLTMGTEIFVYDGKTPLRAGARADDAWQRVSITEPVDLPAGTFFLSASAEYVRVPDGYVGFVEPVASQERLQLIAAGKHPLSTFVSHPNAPFIAPQSVFHGTVTFENFVLQRSDVVAGMFLSDMFLKRLSGNPRPRESRYVGQIDPQHTR